MSLDLNEVKAAQARVYAEVSVYEKGDAALGFLDSGVVDDLVAEIERLRSVPEPDNHHNAYACPHCEAPIHAVEAERDRYRAEWEEAARHALRWQAEYDTAQREVERLRAIEVDALSILSVAFPTATMPWLQEIGVSAGISLLAAERDEACAEVERLRELLDLNEDIVGQRDEARAALDRVRALCEPVARADNPDTVARMLARSVRRAIDGGAS